MGQHLQSLLALCVGCLLLLPASFGLYTSGDAVVELTPKTFDKLVTQSDGVAVVEFYAPWCGHCQQLAPQYKKVAQSLKGIVLVGAVDCDKASNKKLCAQYQIQGFPTIKLFGSDKQKNPYTGEMSKEAQDYMGPRSAKPISDAVTALLTDVHVTHVKSKADLQAFEKKNEGATKVLLFSSKKETTSLYKGLSMQLHRAGLAFGQVHESVEEVVGEYAVEEYPTLKVIKADGTIETYDGELKGAPLLQYLSAFSTAPKQQQEDKDAGGKAAGDKEGSQSSKVPLEPLTLTQAKELDGQEDMWLLAFHVPKAAGEAGECQAEVAALRKALADMQQVVKVGLVAVETEEVEQVAAFGLSSSRLAREPCALQLLLLPFGEDKAELDEYMVYDGPLDGKALQKWVTDAIPNLTMELNPHNAHLFAGSGDSDLALKVLLTSNKDEVPGVYKALAMNLRGKGVTFAWVRANDPANRPIVQQFRTTKVPGLVAMLPIKKSSLGPEERAQVEAEEAAARRSGQPMGPESDYAMSMQPYFGPLKYNALQEWTKQIVMLAELVMGKVPEATAALVPQASSDKEFDELCGSQAGLCVVGLLDPQHSKHEELLKALGTVVARSEGQPFHFLWLDAAALPAVARAFNVMPAQLPALVALSPKRMRYALLPRAADSGSGGAFGAETVRSFLDGVLGGRIRTEVLQELPKFSASAADGTAASDASAAGADEPLVEEEFDLSDIMSEEVEGSEVVVSKEERLRMAEEQIKAEEEARKAAEAAKKKSKKSKKSKKNKKKKSQADQGEVKDEL